MRPVPPMTTIFISSPFSYASDASIRGGPWFLRGWRRCVSVESADTPGRLASRLAGRPGRRSGRDLTSRYAASTDARGRHHRPGPDDGDDPAPPTARRVQLAADTTGP